MLATTSLHPEIKHRLATFSASLKPFSSCVLKREAMQPCTRAKYAQAYLCSKGFFNSATWPALQISEHRSLHSGIMKIYRRIIRDSDGMLAHVSDLDVLRQLKVMSPINAVRYFRLCLAAKIFCSCDSFVLATLYLARNHVRSWIKAMLDDFAFLSAHSHSFSSCSSWNLPQWVSYMISYPKQFKKSIKHAFIHDDIQQHSIPMLVYTSRHTCSIDESFSCNICNYQCDSIQKLNLHKTREHEWLAEAHYFPFEETCPACMKFFHHPIRVFEHIQYKSRVCFHNLLLRGQFLTHEAALSRLRSLRDDANAHVRAGRKRSHATLPCTLAQGPKLPLLPLG